MDETAPTVDVGRIKEKYCGNLKAVARSATALFFALNLSACIEEVEDIKKLSNKYSQPEETAESIPVTYMDCYYRSTAEITPQGDKAFYAENVVMPDGRTATFLLPTLDLPTLFKVRAGDETRQYDPAPTITRELFDGDLTFTNYTNENQALTSIILELDCDD